MSVTPSPNGSIRAPLLRINFSPQKTIGTCEQTKLQPVPEMLRAMIVQDFFSFRSFRDLEKANGAFESSVPRINCSIAFSRNEIESKGLKLLKDIGMFNAFEQN